MKKKIFYLLSEVIKLIYSDNHYHEKEKEHILKIARRAGLSDEEVEHVHKNRENMEFVPPVTLRDKFEHTYLLIKMMLADGKIEDAERKLCFNYARNIGFKTQVIDKAMDKIIEGIEKKKDMDDIFEEVKRMK